MASIGQVTASAATARADSTIALANFNFEISLFTKRVNPPAEYQGVGQHLAEPRLREAQDGAQHSTARKLGLLFKGLLPSTPDLIRAYGSRASEIAKSAQANPVGGVSSYGPFANRIGADATALWAAATSGRAAIQCHLLACMLARMWDGPEATSLWAEITARRKMEVAAKLEAEGEVDSDLMLAASQKFPRSGFAEWDASCRSWLRVADSAKSGMQTQLRLIIDNLDLPVNNKPDTYESVISAWTSAMQEIEKLLRGIPRSVRGGEVLLGLMAWHLYPDLHCLSAQNPEVKLRDPLFSGRGILTIGLEPAPGQDARAVYWTLPLTHLRYYGLPVTKFCSTRTSERDRITVDELLLVWFFAYIKSWDNDPNIPSDKVMLYVGNMAAKLHEALSKTQTGQKEEKRSRSSTANTAPGSLSRPPASWLLLLSQIARKWAVSLDQVRTKTLRNLGRNFSDPVRAPFQDIFTIDTYLKVALELEDKIRFLREIALHLDTQSNLSESYKYLIIYRYDYGNKYPNRFEIATACQEFEMDMEGAVDNLGPSRAHRRWLTLQMSDSERSAGNHTDDRIQQIRRQGEEASYHSNPYPTFTRAPATRLYQAQDKYTSHSRASMQLQSHGPASRENRISRSESASLVMKISPGRRYSYDVLFGDDQSAALLRLRNSEDTRPIIDQHAPAKGNNVGPSYTLSTKKLMSLFDIGRINLNLLAGYLGTYAESNARLLGMTFINNLYKDLRDATVDVRAAKVDLSKAHWVKSAIETTRRRVRRETNRHTSYGGVDCLVPSDVDTSTSFACIAMMETGSFNIPPHELSSVFALCCADSLYIASSLLHDPAHQDPGRVGITRVTGNIGRAGMALMIPPPNPTVRNYDLDDWYQYQYETFDGVLDDSFTGTSLHLSFTKWNQALNIGNTGGKDVEAYLLETLISVYDRDKWISDLDVLSTFRSDRLLKTFLAQNMCDCSTSVSTQVMGNRPSGPPSMRLISIGNFAEIIVTPSETGIIKAKGNWQARLAAASICIAKGYKVILKPQECCWPCLSKVSMSGESVSSIIQASSEIVMIL